MSPPKTTCEIEITRHLGTPVLYKLQVIRRFAQRPRDQFAAASRGGQIECVYAKTHHYELSSIGIERKPLIDSYFTINWGKQGCVMKHLPVGVPKPFFRTRLGVDVIRKRAHNLCLRKLLS